jgi:hypothetical protein
MNAWIHLIIECRTTCKGPSGRMRARGGTVIWGTATSRKVVASILDGVTGIFHWHNPSCQHYCPWDWLSLLQKWVPGIFLWGKGGRCLELRNLPPSCVVCLEIWEPQTTGTLRACPDLYRDCSISYPGAATSSFGGSKNVLVDFMLILSWRWIH